MLPCGHVFCLGCVSDLEGHADLGGCAKCPVCRRLLPSVEDLPVCHLLASLVEAKHPRDYTRRREEFRREPPESDVMPIFVLDSVLPLQQFHMHIYEPRYKLMLQRAMQSGGKPRFGMVGRYVGTRTLLPRGTELEVTECRRVRGNYSIRAVGRRVFLRGETWPLDGYLCSKVTWEDGAGEEEAAAAAARRSSSGEPRPPSDAELTAQIEAWEKLLVSQRWAHRSDLVELRSSLGKLPAGAGPKAYWLGALVNPMPPLGVCREVRPALLSAETDAERLLVATGALAESLAELQSYESSKMPVVLQRLRVSGLARRGYGPLCMAVLLCYAAAYVFRWLFPGDAELSSDAAFAAAT